MAEGDRTPLIPKKNNWRETSIDLRDNFIFGKYKHPCSLLDEEMVFLSFSLVNLLVSMAFTIHRLATLRKDTDDYTFTIMLFFNTLVSVYYVISGVLRERWPELVVLIASCVILLVYLIDNVKYATTIPGKMEKVVHVSFGGVFLVFVLLVGGWLALNYLTRSRMVCLIDCREKMVKKLRLQFVCSSLVALDGQLQVTFLISILENGTAATPWEIGVISGGVIIAIIRFCFGYQGIFKESKYFIWTFFFLCIPNGAYMACKLNKLVHLAPYEKWTTLYHASVVCISFTLILWLILLLAMYMLAKTFGENIADSINCDDNDDKDGAALLSPINESEGRNEMDATGEVARRSPPSP
ncbi:uncharacterized protein LOC144180406 [Haemaphysalis longicornis]